MIEIIPAIDIIEGQCVRLSQGDYTQKTTYFKDPLEVALRYSDIGLKRLHMVDLDGAKASRPVNLAVLEKVSEKTGMDIQYGGGIKSKSSLERVFNSGASRAICGSIAVTEPESFKDWLNEFGNQRIILGADIKDGFIATHGWLESSALTVDGLIEMFLSDNLTQVICTDISKDGMLKGPNYELYTILQKEFPGIAVTVSGGISSMDDILRLNSAGMNSVIVGKAIYEKRISLKEIENFLSGTPPES